MKVIPYLTFEDTIEAIKYYETIFGEILVKRMPMTEEMAKGMGVEGDISGKTLHSELNFGGSLVYASDCFGESNPIHPVSLFLSFDKDKKEEEEKARKIFKTATENETINVVMPLEMQFWGEEMGVFVDKLGNTWMVGISSYLENRKEGGVHETFFN